MNKSNPHSKILGAIAGSTLTSLMGFNFNLVVPQKVEAQTTALVNVNLNRARNINNKLTVYSGRTSIIDFSSSNESIISIKLGDSSRTVYSTDLPLDTGKAKTIFVEAIQPLSFPGATTALVTNLVVKTSNAKGEQQLYVFDIHHGGKAKSSVSGIRLLSGGAMPRTMVATWRVGNGTASLADIEKGLSVAIREGWTSSNAPVVRQVKEFIAMGYNSDLPLEEVAQKVGLSLALVSELATIGLDNRLFFPIHPTSDPEPIFLEPSQSTSSRSRR